MNLDLARNAYRQSEIQTKIHPVKLIHLMYERTLVLLEMAEKGIIEKKSQKRGENIGKAIAIITELNASVKEDDSSEAAQFLRGLYWAILAELPKVAISDDVQIVQRAWKYINRLKEIWEETAMVEAGQQISNEEKESIENEIGVYGAHASEKATACGGVSVSV